MHTAATADCKRRITFVTSIHPDFDARVWKYAKSVSNDGHQVRLICPWKVPSGTIVDGVTLLTFERVRSRALRPILIPLRLFRVLLRVIRQSDLVHFHDIDILPWMALVSFFTPVVYDVHENYAEEMLVRDWIPKPLRKVLFWGVKLLHSSFPRVIRNVVLVVPAQEAEFRARGIRHIAIHNFASAALLDGCEKNHAARPNRIVFTGAHYFENGSLLLIDIARRLIDRGFPTEFLVTDRFASPRFEYEFRKGIDLYKLAAQFSILPATRPTQLMQLLNQATIGIAPNLRVRKQELAIPTKLFEYMAAGLPIVTSDLPFQKHLIETYRVGLLARPEDPDTFVEAIIALAANRDRATTLGSNGQRAFIRHFTWEAQLPTLYRFYDQVTA